jgi:Phosphomannomutase
MGADSLPCFKAYDIRGRVPHDLNLDLVRQTGLAFCAEIGPKTVCVGYDMRLSSKDFALVLAAALMDGGADVTMLGLCGTEEVYYATFSQGFDGGIMITASHNPADWNGLKLVREQAKPLSADSGLFAVRDRVLAGNLPLGERRGNSESRAFRKDYVQHLLRCLGTEKELANLAPLRIVADAGNGCAWLCVEELAKFLPCTIVPLNETPDGTFPNGVPNPLLPENRKGTQEAMLAHKADMGLAWDGDFDRCFFFDEKRRFIEGYYIVGMLAEALLQRHPGDIIIHDPRLTWNTIEIVKNSGGIAKESKSGHAFIKERMRAENALYGGEMSAHHYFRDFGFCDSGMLVWLLVYQLMSRTGKPLSQLVDERIARFPASGEINRQLADPDGSVQRVHDAYAPDALSVSFTDGISMEYADWRFNLRKSNTEPVVRLNVESRGDRALMEKKTAEILQLLDG